MTEHKRQLHVVRVYRIGDNSEEGSAATIGELMECESCGRKISRVHVLTDGGKVGSECATYLTRPDLRRFETRRNRKAEAYLEGTIWA